MSLDVFLREPSNGGIFIRVGEHRKEITREQWHALFPDLDPDEHDIGTEEIYSANITHNLGKMASAAGIYEHLWRPEEIGITNAGQLIAPLTTGLEKLRASPDEFAKHNASNGWGLYEHFVPFVEQYLQACSENPDAVVSVSR